MYVFLLISSQLLVTRRTLTLKGTRLLSSAAVENVVLGRCCQVLPNKRLQRKVAIAVEGCVSVQLPAILAQRVSVAPSSLSFLSFQRFLLSFIGVRPFGGTSVYLIKNRLTKEMRTC